jgi:hypothetical protein
MPYDPVHSAIYNPVVLNNGYFDRELLFQRGNGEQASSLIRMPAAISRQPT